MGQQQLLLLVLSTVIVGLAVVVGINAFEQNQTQSNADALVNEGLRHASDLQAKYLKPEQFGGYGQDWNNASDLTDIGLDNDPATSANGKFTLDTGGSWPCDGSSPSGVEVTVIAGGDNDGDATFAGGSGDNLICIGISGPNSDDVETEVDYAAASSSHSF